MKKLWIVLITLLVLLVGAVALLPGLLNVNRYRGRIQAEVQKHLGRQVQLGEMSVGLFPPTFKVQNAVIAEQPKFSSGQPFARVGELDVELKLAPLLHHHIQIASLRFVHPQIELIHAPDGTWNFFTLEQHGSQPQSSGQQQTPPQLDSLQVDDGTIAVTDLQRHQPRTVYNNIDVLLRDYAPGQAFSLEGSARLPGSGKQAVKFEGHGGPINDATLVNMPFDGSLQLDQVSLAAAKQYLNSPAVAGSDATVGGNLKFRNDAGRLASTGSIRLDNVVVQNKQLGYPIQIDYNTSDELQRRLITLGDTKLKLGNAIFTIQGTVNAAGTPAQADLKLNTTGAPIAELVRLAEVFGASISPGLQPSGQLTADISARGPLTGPALFGTLHGTQLKVSGIEANSLQVNLNLAPPGPEIVRTLTGKVSVALNDGRLTGIDLAQRLGAIGKFTGLSGAGNGATHISSLTGDFDLQNGVASTNNLTALTDAGTVAAIGNASLVDQVLNMKATAVLSKSSSQQVGGSAIGGLMSTALTNQNGEIVVPILVGGTIASPKIAPDTQAIAQMRLHNLIPSFSNPGVLAQGTLSSSGLSALGLGGKKRPGAAAGNQQGSSQQNSIQNAVGGLSGLFGGNKKQQQK